MKCNRFQYRDIHWEVAPIKKKYQIQSMQKNCFVRLVKWNVGSNTHDNQLFLDSSSFNIHYTNR